MAQEPVAGDRVMNNAGSVIFRRLPYYLSPQFDIYENLGSFVRNKIVLEIGFGTGIGVLQYAGRAHSVDAIEIDPAAVRFAKRCFPFQGIAWYEADITTHTESVFSVVTQETGYDLAVMIEVLEHIEFANIALSRVVSLLKPKGQALITVPNKNRARREDDPLIEHEWDAEEFLTELLGHFDDVSFLGYELREYTEFPDATATPLIALCSLAS